MNTFQLSDAVQVHAAEPRRRPIRRWLSLGTPRNRSRHLHEGKIQPQSRQEPRQALRQELSAGRRHRKERKVRPPRRHQADEKNVEQKDELVARLPAQKIPGQGLRLVEESEEEL